MIDTMGGGISLRAELCGALLLVLLVPASSEGSLLLPPAPEYSLTETFEQPAAEDVSSSGSSSEEQDESGDESEVPLDLIARLLKANHSTSTSQTGGSSSFGSGGAGGVTGLMTDPVLTDFGGKCLERVSQEIALSIPSSPSAFIFRPPRVGR